MNGYPIHFAFYFLAGLVIPFKRNSFTTIGILSVAAISEIVQLWMPSRTFDWQDMLMNFLGLIAAWSLVALIHECFPTFYRYYKAKKAGKL